MMMMEDTLLTPASTVIDRGVLFKNRARIDAMRRLSRADWMPWLGERARRDTAPVRKSSPSRDQSTAEN
jgi:hypothetical protein